MDKETFINYLMEQHAKEYIGTDDLMPDAFNDWLADLDVQEVIDYAEKFIKILTIK